MIAKEAVQELTSKEFSGLIHSEKNKDKLIVVDFFAEWCMPCLMMAPVIESLAESHKEVIFSKINIEEARELAKEHNISSIPCIIFFKQGKEVDRIVGSVAEEAIEKKIKEHFK